ncbi:MAG TPA: hypothetical protein VGM90_31445 [Kofleriaceae bacterium]|jgi:hypothetical protein
MSDLRDQLDQIADAAPPPTGSVRDVEIQAAITRGLATPAREARRVWPWIAIGTALAAAAVLLVFLRKEPHVDQQVAIVHDAAVVTPPPPADEVQVVASADTSYVREARKVRLDHGKLTVRAATPIEITTPEVRIVGSSQFVIGRYASETVIEVQEGELYVAPTTGEPVTLHAGERWPALVVVEDAGVVDAAPVIPPHVPAFDASIIRKAIRSGAVDKAREMIAASLTAHPSSKRTLAELGILAAEADLAERHTKTAIDKYLAVVRDFASTPQAEQALFAAAQLAIDRPDAGYKADALLRDYLDTYPKGQFAKDAERLLNK